MVDSYNELYGYRTRTVKVVFFVGYTEIEVKSFFFARSGQFASEGDRVEEVVGKLLKRIVSRESQLNVELMIFLCQSKPLVSKEGKKA